MSKVVIKILQGSAVTHTVFGGLTIYFLVATCKFPIVYMCQKLWKLAGSRQSYCKNYLAYFFWPTLCDIGVSMFACTDLGLYLSI